MMNDDLDLTDASYRWPMIKSRLDRSLKDFEENLNRYILTFDGRVDYSGPVAITRNGKPFTTYCTGAILRPHAPKSLEWYSDERLIEEFDESIDTLYRELLKEFDYRRGLVLTWRSLPTTKIVYPQSIDEVILHGEYMVLPRIYYTMRLAVEQGSY